MVVATGPGHSGSVHSDCGTLFGEEGFLRIEAGANALIIESH